MKMRKIGFQKMLRHKVGGAKMPKAMKAPKMMGADLLEGQTTMTMKKGGSTSKGMKKYARGGVVIPGTGGLSAPAPGTNLNDVSKKRPKVVPGTGGPNYPVTEGKPGRPNILPGRRGWSDDPRTFRPPGPPLPGADGTVRAYKKGGAVKASSITGKGSSPAAAKADYARKMKAAGVTPKMAKGGMAKGPKSGLGIMIVLGKKKGK